MKNLISILLVLGMLILTIPAIALFKKNPHTLNSNEFHSSSTKLTEPESYKMLDTTTNEIIEILPRDYLIGAVFAQMPASFEKEAIKAQVIIAHTYILRQHYLEKSNPTASLCGADFSNNQTQYQGYFTPEQAKNVYSDNYEQSLLKITSAVDEVSNQIITYNEELIFPVFHSMSGGKTESAVNVWGTDFPYLKSVESSFETQDKNFSETKQITVDEMQARLVTNYPDIKLDNDSSKWIKIVQISDSGTVLNVQAGDKTISGSDFRTNLSLRSSCFTLEYKDDIFIIKTKGVGHGVGLSQYGANYMAKSGKTYEAILVYYYKGVNIKTLK